MEFWILSVNILFAKRLKKLTTKVLFQNINYELQWTHIVHIDYFLKPVTKKIK